MNGIVVGVDESTSAAAALRWAAAEADLRGCPVTSHAVDQRGRGGFGGLLLGSVSRHVLTHAHGTVVVVPSV